MRKRNWSKYNKNLVNRGSLTFILSPDRLDEICHFEGKSSGGRPEEHSPTLITILMMIKTYFCLGYRQTEGFGRYLRNEGIISSEIPNYSTLNRRAKTLLKFLPKLSHRRPVVLLFDASGLKVCGEGEWKRKIHGTKRRREWKKIHVALDESSQEVIATTLTKSNVSDGSQVKTLLDNSPKSVTVGKGDGAYDQSAVRNLLNSKGIIDCIPPRVDAVETDGQRERNAAIRIIRYFGGDMVARSLWRKLSGYSFRSLVETFFSRYKSQFGTQLYSKEIQRQNVEHHLKCHILNRLASIN